MCPPMSEVYVNTVMPCDVWPQSGTLRAEMLNPCPERAYTYSSNLVKFGAVDFRIRGHHVSGMTLVWDLTADESRQSIRDTVTALLRLLDHPEDVPK